MASLRYGPVNQRLSSNDSTHLTALQVRFCQGNPLKNPKLLQVPPKDFTWCSGPESHQGGCFRRLKRAIYNLHQSHELRWKPTFMECNGTPLMLKVSFFSCRLHQPKSFLLIHNCNQTSAGSNFLAALQFPNPWLIMADLAQWSPQFKWVLIGGDC